MITVILRIAVLLIGYLFGNFQTAYFYGKAHGIDIREHGSGNAGTTNTLRVLGKKAGLVVFVGDILKTFLPVFLLGLIIDLYFPEYAGIKYLLKLYCGFGTVLGHNYPFYLGFKGGKGIAASSGMMLGFHWPYIIMGLTTFFGTLAIMHYVSLSSLILMGCFFIMTVVMTVFGLGGFAGLETPVIIEMIIVAFIISAFAYMRHKENIIRLINHNERKTYIFKKNKAE